MARKTFKTVAQRRRREGRTNYKLRLRYLVSKKPRFVIRKQSNTIVVQLVEYHPDGDMIKVTVNSSSLKKDGWKFSTKNLPAAYLTGLKAGKMAQSKGIKKAIIDLGMQSKVHGSRLYAVVKGIVDSGMDVPASKECFPSDERLSGSHIANFAEISQKEKEKFKVQFNKYSDASKLPEQFESIKSKVMGS